MCIHSVDNTFICIQTISEIYKVNDVIREEGCFRYFLLKNGLLYKYEKKNLYIYFQNEILINNIFDNINSNLDKKISVHFMLQLNLVLK